MGNPVVHFELIGPDPARLRDFYSQLFGWDAPAGAPVADRISAPTTTPLSRLTRRAAGRIGGGTGVSTATPSSTSACRTSADALALPQKLGAAIILQPQRNEGGQVTVGHFRDTGWQPGWSRQSRLIEPNNRPATFTTTAELMATSGHAAEQARVAIDRRGHPVAWRHAYESISIVKQPRAAKRLYRMPAVVPSG